MTENSRARSITQRYCKRYGAIAVGKSFVAPEDLRKAIDIQVQEDLEAKKHRLIGNILFALELITAEQSDEVLNELFDKSRSEIPS